MAASAGWRPWRSSSQNGAPCPATTFRVRLRMVVKSPTGSRAAAEGLRAALIKQVLRQSGAYAAAKPSGLAAQPDLEATAPTGAWQAAGFTAMLPGDAPHQGKAQAGAVSAARQPLEGLENALRIG